MKYLVFPKFKLEVGMSKQKVILFPSKTQIGQEALRSLADSTHFEPYEINTCGEFPYDVDDPEIGQHLAKYYFDRHPHEKNEALCYLCHDEAIYKLRNDKTGVPAKTVEICRDKKLTYETLADIVKCPKVYPVSALFNYTAFNDGDLFLKPRRGQGSVGCRRIADTISYDDFQLYDDDTDLVCEYLPGKEFSIDAFTDRHGELRFCQARERLETKNGIATKTRLVEPIWGDKDYYGHRSDFHFQYTASAISERLGMRGAWFFQMKQDKDGELTLLEVAPRIAGSSGIHRANGVNLVELTLWDALGEDVEIHYQDIVTESNRKLTSGVKDFTDYNTIYVDFDDCLFNNSNFNIDLIAVLAKFKMNGAKIVMATRNHEVRAIIDMYVTREQQIFLTGLFDRIRVIGDDVTKGCDAVQEHLDDLPAAAIDDSFSELQSYPDFVYKFKPSVFIEVYG